MFMYKKNKEVIEMEQTTFIQRHAKKILVAGGLVVAAGTYYILRKHDIEIKQITDKFNAKINADEIQIKALDAALLDTLEDKNTLMEAASEGLFEEALSKVANKINHRLDRKEFLLEQINNNPNDADLQNTLQKVLAELNVLFARRDKFTKAQALYNIIPSPLIC